MRIFVYTLLSITLGLCLLSERVVAVSRNEETATAALGFGQTNLASGTVYINGWKTSSQGMMVQPTKDTLSGCMIASNIVLTNAHASFLYEKGMTTFVWIGGNVPSSGMLGEELWYEVEDTRLYLQNKWAKMEFDNKAAGDIAHKAFMSSRDVILLRLKKPLTPEHAARVRVYEIGNASECDIKEGLFSSYGYSLLKLANGQVASNPHKFSARRHGFLFRKSFGLNQLNGIGVIKRTSKKLPGSFVNFEPSPHVGELFDGNVQPGDSGGPLVCLPEKPTEKEKLIALCLGTTALGRTPDQTHPNEIRDILKQIYPHLSESAFTKDFIDRYFTQASGEIASMFLTLDHFRPWIQGVLEQESKRLLSGVMVSQATAVQPIRNVYMPPDENFWKTWHARAQWRPDLLSFWALNTKGMVKAYESHVKRIDRVDVSYTTDGRHYVKLYGDRDSFEGFVEPPYEGGSSWLNNPCNAFSGLSVQFPEGLYNLDTTPQRFTELLEMFFKVK